MTGNGSMQYESRIKSDDASTGLRAAQYVRMSTDNQRYSTQNQADAIHTPAIAQAQNQIAIGAAELLGADLEIAAGALAAISATNSIQLKASALTGHARASLANAMAQAAAAH